jgi:hypothetical protein
MDKYFRVLADVVMRIKSKEGADMAPGLGGSGGGGSEDSSARRPDMGYLEIQRHAGSCSASLDGSDLGALLFVAREARSCI